MDESDNEKIQREMHDSYAALGKFVVHFENLIEAINHAIIFFLHKDGLKNQQIAHILLAEQTADPLCRTYQSLIYQLIPLNDVEFKMLDSAFKRLFNLIQLRNNIVHNSWKVGVGSTPNDDFSIAYGSRAKKRKKTNIHEWFIYKPEDFEKHTDEAKNLKMIFNRIHACVTGDYSIEKNFSFNSDEDLIDTPPVKK